MRSPLLLFLALLGMGAGAQNWALLNPAYKYNYSNDGSDTISNQVFVTHIDTLGPDSFRYELNTVTELCDTCQGPQVFLNTNNPQFLQRKVTAGAMVWHFSDPGSFVLLPHMSVGQPWLFDTLASVQATVTLIDTVDQFGMSIARKTIQLSNGNVIELSEAYGILNWVDHTLIGVQGAEVGTLIPPVSAFYPYQAGDVIQYRTEYNTCWPCYGHDSQFKITIAQTEDLDTAIAITGWMTGYTHHYQESNLGNISHWYTYFDEATTWIAGSGTLPFFDLIRSYPGQLVGPAASQTGDVWPMLVGIARHGIDTNGRTIMRCEPIPGVGYFSQPISSTSGPLVEVFAQFESCSDAQPPCGVEYREGTGLVHYGGSFFDRQESFVLDGTVMAGDTTGVLLTDDQLLAVQDASLTNMSGVFPNPANERLTFPPSVTEIEWLVLDVSGRIRAKGRLGVGAHCIDVQALQPGAYVLHLADRHRQRSARFIIAR